MLNFEILFQLDKKFLREVKLSRKLLERSDYCSISYLSKQLDCTEKTTRAALQILASDLPPEWKLLHSKNIGVFLEKPLNSTNDTLFSYLAENTLTFQIIYHLYEEKYERVADLADDLFISVPLLYKYLTHLEEELIKSGIYLNKKPLQLEGNENNIRMFYYSFFADLSYSCILNKNSAQEYLESYDGFSANIIKKDVSHLMLSILINRLVHGHFITEPINLLVSDSNFLCATLLSEKLHADFHVALSQEELTWIAFSLFEQNQPGNDGNHLLTQHADFKALLAKLSNLFPLHLEKDEIFKQILANQIVYANTTNTLAVMTSKNIVLDAYFEEHQADLYKAVSDIYVSFDADSSLFQINTIENVIETMFYFIDQDTTSIKRALLLTQKGEAWERFISTTITSKVHHKLVISTEKELSLNDDFDLIISDHCIPDAPQPTVVISLFPTDRDVKAIESVLNH
ncbi:helix-turn-helix domain-containing protein [Listeria booriae]|uniref:helix-turn-helix domain-containing protein n=1 Tax=Listeria booriae TaxID=1552123 RepID=UPI001629354C|nr:helix-turn-helix domain-containing protein [Listeria booriae]MBC2322480.1 hypothetical protein [Listeria booriae]MCD2206513.1 helix-turn-helix domain-containing protein [Listeria booriae]